MDFLLHFSPKFESKPAIFKLQFLGFLGKTGENFYIHVNSKKIAF